LAVRLCIIPGSAYSALCGAPHNAEFECALIRERQREGIALAKQRGAYSGRKKSLSPEKAAALKKRAAAGEKKASLAREFGISRDTLYQYLRESATIPEGSDV
jgi:DNA invertase Pin-like site-specific DNA recombinase